MIFSSKKANFEILKCHFAYIKSGLFIQVYEELLCIYWIKVIYTGLSSVTLWIKVIYRGLWSVTLHILNQGYLYRLWNVTLHIFDQRYLYRLMKYHLAYIKSGLFIQVFEVSCCICWIRVIYTGKQLVLVVFYTF